MPSPKTLSMSFYECEHEGDLDRYLRDLNRCGARVQNSSINFDAETAEVIIQIPDFAAFKSEWQKTESADFADSLDWFEDKEPGDA